MNKQRRRFVRRLLVMAVATLVLAVFGASTGFAQDAPAAPTAEEFAALKVSIDTSWVLITGFLVFLMQLGFAILETGMIQQTSAVNALLENFSEAAIGALAWWIIGFGLAFGVDNGSGLFGTTLFAPGVEMADTIYYGNISVLTMFFFQFAFAATASTITTGAMAERTNFVGHIIYNVVIVAFIYPIVVHWVWGGGWLFQQGFFDFAGGAVVHTVGAVIALVGAIFLGPRKGKVWGKPMTAHNLGLALIGTLILWFGWYGFNPGSTLGSFGVTGTIGIVILNTSLGGAAGLMSAMIYQYVRTGKWDLIATMNGSLAGLVIVTPGCAFIAPLPALLLGLAGGVIVLLLTDAIEKMKIDDAVGAFAVHAGGGITGIIGIGLFAEPSLTGFAGNVKAGFGGLLIPGGSADILITQVIGIVAVIAWCAVTSTTMFAALQAVGLLRVHPDAEKDGMFIDAYEHGQTIMPDLIPLPEERAAVHGRSTVPAAAGD